MNPLVLSSPYTGDLRVGRCLKVRVLGTASRKWDFFHDMS